MAFKPTFSFLSLTSLSLDYKIANTLSPTNTHTHYLFSLSFSISLSTTHIHTHSHTHTQTLSFSIHLPLSLSHPHFLSLSDPHAHTHTLSLSVTLPRFMNFARPGFKMWHQWMLCFYRVSWLSLFSSNFGNYQIKLSHSIIYSIKFSVGLR